jgi:TM2 domain-containing membrane protein YozV
MSNPNESWSVISVGVLLTLLLGIIIGLVLKVSFRSLKSLYRSVVNLFRGKSRKKIAWIAITLGWLGIHRFKLGNKKEGIINLVITLLPVIPGGIVFFLIGVFEGVKYLRMSDLDFEETYLSRKKKWF